MGGFKVIGMDKLKRNIQKAISGERQKALQAINDIGDIALTGAVEHAPVDEGFLQASIEKSIQETPQTLHAVIRVPNNVPAADYAIPMHEDMYQPGADSQGKARRNGLPVGRKYITNGIKHARPSFKKIIERRMKS